MDYNKLIKKQIDFNFLNREIKGNIHFLIIKIIIL